MSVRFVFVLLATCMACGTPSHVEEDPSDEEPVGGRVDAGDQRDARASAKMDASVDASRAQPPRRDAGSSFPPDDCSDDARWIYLVDANKAFLRYEPNTNTLTKLGTLDCSSSASPFSMAVSRDAVAYVLYSDSRLYEVSAHDVSCKPSTYAASAGFGTFGMGFATDEKGGRTETLYVAGATGGDTRLASLDPKSWMFKTLGPVGGQAELTGNANGELWGFFPTVSPFVVRNLDKTTGATLRELDVSAIVKPGLGFGPSWAFAFWGGKYYMFYYDGNLLGSTGIFRLDPTTGKVETIKENIGYSIVGAGVSTCAPVEVLI